MGKISDSIHLPKYIAPAGSSAYNLFEYWNVEADHWMFIKHPAKVVSTFQMGMYYQ